MNSPVNLLVFSNKIITQLWSISNPVRRFEIPLGNVASLFFFFSQSVSYIESTFGLMGQVITCPSRTSSPIRSVLDHKIALLT